MKLHPGYEKRPSDPNFRDCVKTILTEEEATYYLKEAWKKVYNEYPSKNSLALLWAQSAGETGRWKLLRNYNWGNIKKRKNDTEQLWTSYDAGENLTINGVYKHYMFYPYHPQTHFAAWDDALSGAEYYIRFLSQRKRYLRAWQEVIKGDPVAYCKELKAAGYFTAGLAHYTKGVVSLTNEFKRKSEKLMSWAPVPPSTPPPKIDLDPIEKSPDSIESGPSKETKNSEPAETKMTGNIETKNIESSIEVKQNILGQLLARILMFINAIFRR